MKKIAASLVLLSFMAPLLANSAPEKRISVVLVHGAFVDGSGWKAVYDLLSEQGYEVLVSQHSTATLEGDAAIVRSLIDSARFPVVLVGHSYGGMVISVAGDHRKVDRLVYVAAYAPEKGESVAKLAQVAAQPGESRAPLLPVRDAHRLVDPAKFPEAFAADVPLSTSRFMAASQVPWGLAAVQAEVADPAWKVKPTSHLVTTKDRMIPPSVQRMMVKRVMSQNKASRVVEVESSHAVMLSHPQRVASLITESLNLSTTGQASVP